MNPHMIRVLYNSIKYLIDLFRPKLVSILIQPLFRFIFSWVEAYFLYLLNV